MRIVITRRAPLDTPDGINIFIFSLAQEFIARAHDVTVVGTTGADGSTIESLYRMPRYPRIRAVSSRDETSANHGKTVAAWFRVGKRLIDDLEPDLVILNGALPFSFRGSTCTVAHDLEKRVTKIDLLRNSYKRVAYGKSRHVVATTTELKWGLSGQLGIEPGRIRVIPTCLDVGLYHGKPRSDREDAILHIGTTPYKNPLQSLEAFTRLDSSSAVFYLVGAMNDVVLRYLDRLHSRTRARIKTLGYVSAERLRELLGSVKLVSVPSKYFVPVASPTVMEAFASSTPVVGSDSITADLIRDRENGFVCPEGAAGEMARRFEELLEDAGQWETLSRTARRTAERFSANSVAQSYVALVQSGQTG